MGHHDQTPVRIETQRAEGRRGIDLYENYARRKKLLDLCSLVGDIKVVSSTSVEKGQFTLVVKPIDGHSNERELATDKHHWCAHWNRNSQREVGVYKQHAVFSLVAHLICAYCCHSPS